MFSGLVRQYAKVRFYRDSILSLESNLHPAIGDSIAVNGACLTAIESTPTYFNVELSAASAALLAVENLCGVVHIEPALKLSDGLHGHIVQGHVDAIGTITSITPRANQHTFQIETTSEALLCMIPKGSVCIDGISLTIHEVFDASFSLVIIPHTIQNTLLAQYKVGRRVNIETDIITRSVANMLHRYMQTHGSMPQKDRKQTMQDIYDSMTLGY